MIISIRILLCALFLVLEAQAQDHLIFRLNEKGFIKILKMAASYNTGKNNSQSITVPENLYKFVLPKAQLLANPVVAAVNEYSNLDLSSDLEFYLRTSAISITGNYDPRSIRAEISNSTARGFDLRLTLTIPQVRVSSPSISLCEDRLGSTKRCGGGLEARVTNLNVRTTGRPTVLTTVLRVRTDRNTVRATVKSVSSNLESGSSPGVDIDFQAVSIPPVAITINGDRTELDTSRLRDEILKRRQFMAKKLLSFVADFIAADVAEMLNVYLVNKSVSTAWNLYRHEAPINFDELRRGSRYIAQPDATFVRQRFDLGGVKPKQANPMTLMMGQIAEVIRNAKVDLSVTRVSTPGNKDIELAGALGLTLNDRRLNVDSLIGNSTRRLPPLRLSEHRSHDLNLAISEPLVNGALALANSTGLFQDLFDTFGGTRGFRIRNVRAHFTTGRSIVVVVNSSIVLSDLRSEGMVDWVKKRIGAWLERNNNDGRIDFPIEVEVVPLIRTLANGEVQLRLQVHSPFKNNALKNTFGYPTNVNAMNDTVRQAVLEDLRENLGPHTDKAYTVNLNQFLNQSGVVFRPKGISFSQGAYILLNLDIDSIRFDSLNPRRR